MRWAAASFPADPDDAPEEGINWWNSIAEDERAHWLAQASSARPVDAWGAFLRSKAHADADAVAEGQEWVERMEAACRLYRWVDYRHTSALTVLQATKDLRKVSLWLGHASMQTTEMYYRPKVFMCSLGSGSLTAK